MAQNSSAPRSQEDYITQVSEEIEGRVTKWLSKEFSRTENRILGALARLDDFLMNPLLPGHSGTIPESSRNALNKSQGTNEDDSQNDPCPEAGLHGQMTRNFGPEDGHDRYRLDCVVIACQRLNNKNGSSSFLRIKTDILKGCSRSHIKLAIYFDFSIWAESGKMPLPENHSPKMIQNSALRKTSPYKKLNNCKQLCFEWFLLYILTTQCTRLTSYLVLPPRKLCWREQTTKGSL